MLSGARADRRRFPRSHRLLKSEEFARVKRSGRPLRNRLLRAHVLVEGDRPPRLGLAISRAAGNAVRRNRIKRLLREAFRLEPGLFPPGTDLVLSVQRSARDTDSLEAFAEALRDLARRLRTPPPPRVEPCAGS